jgi:hypothetical protein
MPESLLSPSQIKLFGREFPELVLDGAIFEPVTSQEQATIDKAKAEITAAVASIQKIVAALGLSGAAAQAAEKRLLAELESSTVDTYLDAVVKPKRLRSDPLGANNFLRQQILAEGARLARIYAFAYEGDLYFLPKPYVFLVHGPGLLVIEPSRYQNSPNFQEASQTGVTVDRWGVIAKIDRFADDVRVWDYDKDDFSLRLDIISGTLTELVLEPAMSGDGSTSRADMTSRAHMAMRAHMAAPGQSSPDMAARAHLAVRHRFTR